MSNASAFKNPPMRWDTVSAGQSVPHKARSLLPFQWMEAIAIGTDLLLIAATSLLSGIAYDVMFLGGLGPIAAFLGVGILVGINFTAIMAARGSYRPQKLASASRQVRVITTVWLFVFFVLLAAAFSLKVAEEYSRGAILTFFVVGWTSVIGWRLIVARIITRGLERASFAEQKSILIAQRELAGASVVEELRRCGYRPIRTFEFGSIAARAAHSAQLLRLVQEVIEVTRNEQVRQVFLLASWNNRHVIERLMELLRVVAVPIYLLPDENVSRLLGNRMIDVGTAWMAELKRAPLTATEQTCKRAFDILGAAAALFLLAPMMAVIAVLIKIDSRGPILFRQTRNGFNGRPFRIWKFRTMNVLEDGAVIRQATKDDPRITRLGRLLRRGNLDELPQLLNVIAGNMSLVGPRPHALAHNSEYEKTIQTYAYRYHVKPGLTGWAQVNGLRGETQTVDLMAKRVEFDLWYIDNWSLWRDLRILLRTLVIGLQPAAY